MSAPSWLNHDKFVIDTFAEKVRALVETGIRDAVCLRDLEGVCLLDGLCR